MDMHHRFPLGGQNSLLPLLPSIRDLTKTSTGKMQTAFPGTKRTPTQSLKVTLSVSNKTRISQFTKLTTMSPSPLQSVTQAMKVKEQLTLELKLR